MQDNIVRVQSLELENFRGFKELTLQFSNQPIVVFFGENGAGKSTILNAIAFSLKETINFFLKDGKDFFPVIHRENIGHHGQDAKIIVGLNTYEKLFSITYDIAISVYDDEIEAGIKRDKFSAYRTPFKPFPTISSEQAQKAIDTLTETNNDKLKYGKTYKFPDTDPVEEETKALVDHLLYNFPKKSFPLFLHYSVNRLITSSINQKDEFDPLATLREADAYKGAFQAVTNFNDFFNWYKILEDQENERKSRILTDILNKSKSIEDYKDSLKTTISFVREAIYCFIPYLDDIRVVREGKSKIKVLADKKGKKYDLEQLSQGEKMLLSMVGDIAVRLAILNPQAEKPLLGSGIILIDEIDLHLHPTWQRNILEKLHETFPNCQFIVTTHSPQVLGETKRADVFFLSSNNEGDFEAEKIDHIYGKNSNEVLEYFMSTPARSKEVGELINTLLKNIQDRKFSKVDKQLFKLEKMLGINAPALIKARLLLKKMKLRHAKDNKKD